MERPTGASDVGDAIVQGLVVKEGFVADCVGDPHQLLIDDSPSTNVLMSDFAVSHDSVGQSDVFPGSVNLSVGVFLQQSVVDRSVRKMDGVAVVEFRMRIVAPAVSNNQYYWSFLVGHAAQLCMN